MTKELIETYRGKGLIFRQAYGATEGGGMIAFSSEAYALKLPSTAGWPLPTLEMRVMSAEDEPCPTDMVGEIQLRGPQVMSGYWRNPDANEAAFVDGWYRTGDLGFLNADGAITIVDRLKNMIISGGLNIYPAEIERAFAAIPSIIEVAVIGAKDEQWGERIVALLHGPALDEVPAIHTRIREMLGSMKTPREILVSPTPLPRTMTDKIARKELQAVYVELARTASADA